MFNICFTMTKEQNPFNAVFKVQMNQRLVGKQTADL